MSSSRDYIRSVITDMALPLTRQLFEDVVIEVMNERQVPTRTDFKELRDVVNGMRGKTTSAASTAKKLDKRLAELEEKVAALSTENEALRAQVKKAAPKPARKTARKTAARPAKKASRNTKKKSA